mgnify:CR=1 FL=1
MDRKEFFKPTKRKVILAIVLFVIVFLIPYFKLGGEIFQGGYIRAPFILVIATYLAFSIPDFMVGKVILEIPFYLLSLFILIFITYSIACFADMMLTKKV